MRDAPEPRTRAAERAEITSRREYLACLESHAVTEFLGNDIRSAFIPASFFLTLLLPVLLCPESLARETFLSFLSIFLFDSFYRWNRNEQPLVIGVETNDTR